MTGDETWDENRRLIRQAILLLERNDRTAFKLIEDLREKLNNEITGIKVLIVTENAELKAEMMKEINDLSAEIGPLKTKMAIIAAVAVLAGSVASGVLVKLIW